MAILYCFLVGLLLVNGISAAGLRVKKQIDFGGDGHGDGGHGDGGHGDGGHGDGGHGDGGHDHPQPGYSGSVVDGKSSYILKFNRGVPVYGGGEPYYFSYTHNFPIASNDFEDQVNSHNLPKKYKFTGSLDVTALL
ncbi:hypothetical protein CHUAL_005233 [Chamberlinius hualienensis]